MNRLGQTGKDAFLAYSLLNMPGVAMQANYNAAENLRSPGETSVQPTQIAGRETTMEHTDGQTQSLPQSGWQNGFFSLHRVQPGL